LHDLVKFQVRIKRQDGLLPSTAAKNVLARVCKLGGGCLIYTTRSIYAEASQEATLLRSLIRCLVRANLQFPVDAAAYAMRLLLLLSTHGRGIEASSSKAGSDK